MPDWSAKESAIVLYFISRGIPYDVSSDVIKLRCGTTRSRTMCQHRVQNIRKNMLQEHGLADPYDPTTKRYGVNIVDHWLRRQMDMDMLNELLAIDAQVEQIMRNHV